MFFESTIPRADVMPNVPVNLWSTIEIVLETFFSNPINLNNIAGLETIYYLGPKKIDIFLWNRFHNNGSTFYPVEAGSIGRERAMLTTYVCWHAISRH